MSATIPAGNHIRVRFADDRDPDASAVSRVDRPSDGMTPVPPYSR
ncbi:hypothetical protein ACIQNU_00725 [Streptomyces sp. NPDC091292]